MRRALLLSVFLPFVAFSVPSKAQEIAGETAAPVLLLADNLFVTSDRQLVAEGNVEAIQQGTRLTAHRITFDQEGGTLKIEGPIRIDDGTGTTILADAAEMDRDLQNGLLSGARVVLQQQLQMAAVRMNRVQGRYTQLYKTSATSCHVCEDGKPPIWQIRASKLTHDQQEKQLYFEGAQLRVLDVPVFYFPALRLPDPSLERSNGFLVPKVRSTSNLGTGLKVPYFITLGDSRDLTLTPYFSSKTRTLGIAYRQAFKAGRINFEGAYTRDDLQPDDTRGYIFGDGQFELKNGFDLEFEIQAVSDDAYLADYGLPDQDRLRSQLTITKARRNSFLRAGVFDIKSLRDEDDDLQPNKVADFFYQNRLHPAAGGELRLTFHSHAHFRSSTDQGTVDSANGRDVVRHTADAEWTQKRILGSGNIAEFKVGASADYFQYRDESYYSSPAQRFTPRTAFTMRRPMTRTDSTGATQYLEPILQVGWSAVTGDEVASDESTLAEFDQGNLLELSRFPSVDAREDGLSLVYGLNWARNTPGGTRALATIGQVIRQDGEAGFSQSSGLSGAHSDLLLAGQLNLHDHFGLTARGLLDDSLSFSKAEFRGDWHNDRTTLSGTYLWLETDTEEGRDQDTSEIWLDGDYSINQNWAANANLRYDFTESEPSRAGLGLVYSNECVKVDLSVNRRYTSNSSIEPSTDFSFSVALGGFLAGSGDQTYRRSCKNT